MELNVLFQHSITTKNGVIESVAIAEFGGHLKIIVKHDENKVLPNKCHSRYHYFVGEDFTVSDKDIDIIEALKEYLGLKNNSKTIDPDFYFEPY